MKRLTVVFYAVNGTGTGHLTRLVAIARWMRRYTAFLGTSLDAIFLTTSEADRLAYDAGFPSFKIPSKTLVRESGMDTTAYRALAKQWVWHTLGLLRPDLLVVDTFPRGSFGELGPALDLVANKAFIYRPTRREVVERPDFQAMLPLYDLVLIPDASAATMPVPDAARDRVVEVGPVVSIDGFELLSRDHARVRLGLPCEGTAVLVTAGGGGDQSTDIGALARGVAARGHSVLVGAGPLYRGLPVVGDRITFSREPGLASSLRAFDVAISAAGYNSFHELSLAGVPAVYVPQSKLADDQASRASTAERAGVASVAPGGSSVGDILSFVDARLAAGPVDPHVARSHARDAAAELLRLVASPVEVDRAAHTLDDATLRRAAPDAEGSWLSLLGLVARGHSLDAATIERLAVATDGDPDAARQLAAALLWKRGGNPRARAALLSASLPHARRLGDAGLVVRLIHQLSATGGAASVPASLQSLAERGVGVLDALAST